MSTEGLSQPEWSPCITEVAINYPLIHQTVCHSFKLRRLAALSRLVNNPEPTNEEREGTEGSLLLQRGFIINGSLDKKAIKWRETKRQTQLTNIANILDPGSTLIRF